MLILHVGHAGNGLLMWGEESGQETALTKPASPAPAKLLPASLSDTPTMPAEAWPKPSVA